MRRAQGLLSTAGSRHTASSSLSPLTASSSDMDILDVDSVFDSPCFSLGPEGSPKTEGAADVVRSLVDVNKPLSDYGSPTFSTPCLSQDLQDLQGLLADTSRARLRSERVVDRDRCRGRTKRLERFLSEPHR